MADSKTFQVTPQQLEGLSAYLKGHGLVLDPAAPQGSAVDADWDISWTILDGNLTVTVNKHPFAEEGFFWKKLQGLLS